MKLYLNLDSSRCFALPDDQELPAGETVVRRLMHAPEYADLDALTQWEIPREEGLELARSMLGTSATAKFEAQILELQEDLRKPETREGLNKVAEGLKKLGQDARARRLARKQRGDG